MFLSSCEASTFNIAFSRLMCIPSTKTRKKSQDALMSAVSCEACLTILPHLKSIPYTIYAPNFPVRRVAGIEGHNNFPLSRPFSFACSQLRPEDSGAVCTGLHRQTYRTTRTKGLDRWAVGAGGREGGRGCPDMVHRPGQDDPAVTTVSTLVADPTRTHAHCCKINASR